MTTQAVVDQPKRRGRVTADERAQIVALIEAGRYGCNEIARMVGRDRSTVSHIAAAEGLEFDRSQVRAAVEAKKIDTQARLAELAELLAEDAHRLRAQLWEPCTVYSFGGKENTFNEAQITEPDFRAKQAILTSVGIATDKVIAIRKAEAGPGEATGLIVDLVQAIRGGQ